VWVDGDDAFRARLSSTGPDGRPPVEGRTVATAASAGDVLSAVRTWLDEFLDDAQDPVDSPP
jgi:hypothetical protein